MCARFSLALSTDAIERLLDVDIPHAIPPRANIAPTLDVPAAVLSSDGRDFKMLRWGLIPIWTKDPKMAQKLINARAETASEKPVFREALRKRRCIIPATSFYEWRDEASEPTLDLGLCRPSKSAKTYKQPYAFTLASGDPFVFAGLYDRWQNPATTDWLHTFTILTVEPNALLEEFHDRMPCILTNAQVQHWMDPDVKDFEALMPILASSTDLELIATRTDPRLNNPRFEPFAL